MAYTKIDSFDITFPDCSARCELKVNELRKHIDGSIAKKGTGEKRLYCGADKEKLDAFFGFSDENTSQKFFILKDDLETYCVAIEKEYKHKSTYKYKNKNILINIYNEYCTNLENLDKEILELEFIHSFDSQNRYYLAIDNSKNNKKKSNYYKIWDYIRDICLPRVTRLLFMKLEDALGETSFYIKPFYGYGLFPKGNVGYETKARGGQAKYRDFIFNKYKKCVVTGVANPKLLVACHIIPFSECKKKTIYEHYKYHEQNGFLMTPTIHKLFDLGYLSFNESDGTIMLSDFLIASDRDRLNIKEETKVEVDNSDLAKCLKWHNKYIFVNVSSKLDLNK